MNENGNNEMLIEFRDNGNMPSLYATNLVFQRTEEAIVLSFYEVNIPVNEIAPNGQNNTLSQLKGLPAYCVARITMSPSKIQSIADLFNQVLERELNTSAKVEL